jgi:hypothetical protein
MTRPNGRDAWEQLDAVRQELEEDNRLAHVLFFGLSSDDPDKHEEAREAHQELMRRKWKRSGSTMPFENWRAADEAEFERDLNDPRGLEMIPRDYEGSPPSDEEVARFIEEDPDREDLDEAWKDAATGQTLIEYVRDFVYQSPEERRQWLEAIPDEKLMQAIGRAEGGVSGVFTDHPDPSTVRSHREYLGEFARRFGPDPRGDVGRPR